MQVYSYGLGSMRLNTNSAPGATYNMGCIYICLRDQL